MNTTDTLKNIKNANLCEFLYLWLSMYEKNLKKNVL